jgi:hypothetical protein
MEVSGQLHAKAALPPEKKKRTRYPPDRRLGGLDTIANRKQISAPATYPVRLFRSSDTILTELPRLLQLKAVFRDSVIKTKNYL